MQQLSTGLTQIGGLGSAQVLADSLSQSLPLMVLLCSLIRAVGVEVVLPHSVNLDYDWNRVVLEVVAPNELTGGGPNIYLGHHPGDPVSVELDRTK